MMRSWLDVAGMEVLRRGQSFRPIHKTGAVRTVRLPDRSVANFVKA